MIVVFASTVPPELARALDLAGYTWKGVASPDEATESEPAEGWQAAIIDVSADADGSWAFDRLLRKTEGSTMKVLLLVGGGQLADLDLRDDLFDDFCLLPLQPRELDARLKHLFWRTGRGTSPDLIEYGPLVLNLET